MNQRKTKAQLYSELKDLQSRYDQLLHYLPDALIEIDILNRKLLYMNQTACTLFGYSSDDVVIGIEPERLFAEEEEYECALKLIRDYAGKSLEESTPYKRMAEQIIDEFQMRKKDGTFFTAEVQSSFVLDAKAMPIALRSIIRDATGRIKEESARLRAVTAKEKTKAAQKLNLELQKEIEHRNQIEEALRHSQERYKELYKELYQHLPSMYFTVNEKNRIISVNKFGAEQLRYSVDELIGKSVFDVFHKEDQKEVKKQFRECFKNTNQVYQWHFRKVTKPGNVIWVRETARAIETEDGVSVFIVSEDITMIKKAEVEQKQLENQILQAQKWESLGDLAGGLAHDFNNLLTGILGHATLAKMDLPGTFSAVDDLKRIEQSALKAAELTNQLLAYAGKGKYVVRKHDLSQLIKDMTAFLQTAIDRKIHLKFDLKGDLALIEADSSQLHQLIMNLVTNAADAVGKKRGTIEVSTGSVLLGEDNLAETIAVHEPHVGNYVFIEVTDNGCGMDKETESKVFDPFFSTKRMGRGLGLAAVLGIVRSHKGLIKLKSKPGSGTRITIFFPAVKMNGEKTDHIIKKAAGQNGKSTILVVDDQVPARMVAQKVLQKFGFDVLSAKDGREGVHVFKQNADKINVVLLDMSMPEMNGEEALQKIRDIRPDIRVILSSGYSEEETISKFSATELSGFIKKPYKLDDLISTINGILQS